MDSFSTQISFEGNIQILAFGVFESSPVPFIKGFPEPLELVDKILYKLSMLGVVSSEVFFAGSGVQFDSVFGSWSHVSKGLEMET